MSVGDQRMVTVCEHCLEGWDAELSGHFLKGDCHDSGTAAARHVCDPWFIRCSLHCSVRREVWQAALK
jgi:hypothetical protein